MTVAMLVGDDALKNYFVGAVEQRPYSDENFARRSEARVIRRQRLSSGMRKSSK